MTKQIPLWVGGQKKACRRFTILALVIISVVYCSTHTAEAPVYWLFKRRRIPSR